MQASKQDSRVFASYPMPAKIDLLNEQPRRESLVEQQLANPIGQVAPGMPRIMVSTSGGSNTNSTMVSQEHQQQQHQQPTSFAPGQLGSVANCEGTITSQTHSPTPRGELKETRIVINRHSSPIHSHYSRPSEHSDIYTSTIVTQQQQQQQRPLQQQPSYSPQEMQQTTMQEQRGGLAARPSEQFERIVTSKTTTTNTTTSSFNKETLANELAEKEAKLMRDIEALNQRPYSPYASPAKVDITSEQRINSSQQQQQQRQFSASPRPHSSASSSADLLEKEAKLFKEIEEIESKPFNPQTMVVEREKWYEYPENRPSARHLTDSTRRVRDFCTMATELCQDRHVHDQNATAHNRTTPTPGSIHTTIIRSPKRDIDNKSPLPFAFDNFTTKGVRGNIATVGAVEPDRPRAPIFPIVKRTPSPATLGN